MAVVVTTAAPAVGDEDPRPCLRLTTLAGLFRRDQSPSQALCSLLAMLWFWSGCKAEEKDLLLGSVLLALVRWLKRRTACLLVDLLSCWSCHRGIKGDKQPVTMSVSSLGGWGLSFLDGAARRLLQPSVRFSWICRSCERLSGCQSLVPLRCLLPVCGQLGQRLVNHHHSTAEGSI